MDEVLDDLLKGRVFGLEVEEGLVLGETAAASSVS